MALRLIFGSKLVSLTLTDKSAHSLNANMPYIFEKRKGKKRKEKDRTEQERERRERREKD